MAACYFAAKRSKDPEVRRTAIELLTKFSQTLSRNVFRFGPKSGYATPPGCLYVFNYVLQDLHIPHDWTARVFAYYLENVADSLIDETLAWARGQAVDLLRDEVDKLRIGGFGIPNHVKNDVVNAFKKAMDGITSVNNFREQAKSRLLGIQRYLPCNAILNIDALVAQLLDESDIAALLFNLDAKGWVRTVSKAGGAVSECFSVHLLFWEILLLQECGACDSGLRRTAFDLEDACEKYNMLLLSWLVGSRGKVENALRQWNPTWNNVEYMWQADLDEQNDNRNKNEQAARHPRIDFMILYQLYMYKPNGALRSSDKTGRNYIQS